MTTSPPARRDGDAPWSRERRRRWLRWVAAGALTLATGIAVFMAMRPPPLRVDVGWVALGRFEQVIREEGRLRLRERFVVTSPISGELQRLTWVVGDEVRAGQRLVHFRPNAVVPLDSRARAMAAARMEAAKDNLASTRSQAERARVLHDQALLEFERIKALALRGFVAQAAQDQALAAQRAQAESLQTAIAQWQAAEHGLAEAKAALETFLPEAAAARPAGASPTVLSSIVSPIDGRILKVHLNGPAPVQAGQALLEIGDPRRLEAVIELLSADALRLSSNAQVTLLLGIGLRPIAGLVQRVEPIAHTKVSALGVEEQRVNLIVDLQPGDWQVLALGDGFRVEASVVTASQDNALLVPAGSLQRDGRGWSVLRVVDGRAQRVGLELIDRNVDWAWVRGALGVGEAVILYPGPQLGPGHRVRISPESAPARR